MKNSALIFALFLMTLISFTACKKDVIIEPFFPEEEIESTDYVISFYIPGYSTLFYLAGYRDLVFESLSIAPINDDSGQLKYLMPVLTYEDNLEIRSINPFELNLECFQVLSSSLPEITQDDFLDFLDDTKCKHFFFLSHPINMELKATDLPFTLRNNARCEQVDRTGNCHNIGETSNINIYEERYYCREGQGVCKEHYDRIGRNVTYRENNCKGGVLTETELKGHFCRP